MPDQHSKTDYSQPDPSDIEQLTAYLDGELHADEIHAVEKRLETDKAYRFELQRLQRTWDFLDDLPHSPVSAEFTQSTIEMVVQDAAGLLRKEKRNNTSWIWRTAAIIATPLVGLFGGQYVTAYVQNAPLRELARDLPLIENVDVYQKVESFEFLNSLHESGLFDDSSFNSDLGDKE